MNRNEKQLARRSSQDGPPSPVSGSAPARRHRFGRRFAPASEGGFTLVEILVVITIITLLVSLLVVLIGGLIDRARYAKTAATVKLLDGACKTYKLDYGEYPPDTKKSSASLHHHLGIERKIVTQKSELGPSLISTKPPIVDWQRDMLDDSKGNPDPRTNPVRIMDAFGQPIRYVIPAKYNKNGPDIWSPGKNEKDEYVETASDYDDVTNWAKEY